MLEETIFQLIFLIFFFHYYLDDRKMILKKKTNLQANYGKLGPQLFSSYPSSYTRCLNGTFPSRNSSVKTLAHLPKLERYWVSKI